LETLAFTDGTPLSALGPDQEPDSVSLKYAAGGLTASLFREQVCIGPRACANVGFLGTKHEDMLPFADLPADGILGLAHYYAHEDSKGPHAKTFISTVFEQYPDLPKRFSFFLTGREDELSKLIFGDPGIERYAKEEEFLFGKSYYADKTDLWLTSVWSIGWTGTGVEISFPERGTLGAPALVDSGSSLIVLTPQIYDVLIGELQQWLGTCGNVPGKESILMCHCPSSHFSLDIPSLAITMIDDSDQQFSLCLSPDEYILQSVNPLSGDTACVPAIQRGSAKQPVPMIFGMTFLRSFYTVFELENHRVGFARSNLSPLPAQWQRHPAWRQ